MNVHQNKLFSRAIILLFLLLSLFLIIPAQALSAGPKYVALTFDDGPHRSYTPSILDALKQAGVPATFFMNGKTMRENQALVKRIAQEGHQVASHAWKHNDMRRLSSAKNKKSLLKTNRLIFNLTGQTNSYVRPPYGALNKRVKTTIKRLKMKKILWTHDTLDWQRPGVKKIVARATKKVRNGSIILMHDGGGNRKQTVKALPRIIAKLKAQGYTFVTVGELHRLGLLH